MTILTLSAMSKFDSGEVFSAGIFLPDVEKIDLSGLQVLISLKKSENVNTKLLSGKLRTENANDILHSSGLLSRANLIDLDCGDQEFWESVL